MKRFLLLCLFVVPHAFGMEATLPYSAGSMVPVMPQSMMPGVAEEHGASMSPFSSDFVPENRLPSEKKEPLADTLLILARATHDGDTERAFACMQEVEKRVEEEEPTNLLLLLKQRGVHTHVMALLEDGRPSSAYRAQLLGKFGALLLRASGENDSALQDGLGCVLKALESDGLGEEEKREVREIKRQYYKRLGIKKKKKKTRREKKGAESEVTVYAGADTEDAQQGETTAQPLRFLTKDRPSFPGRRLPTKGIAGLLVRQSELLPIKKASVEQEKDPKKKKKTRRKKKETPLDTSQFTGPWDEVVMNVLGKKHKSYEHAIEYLTRPNTPFEITDPRLKEVLLARLRGAIPVPDGVSLDDQCQGEGGLSDGSISVQQRSYVLGRLLLENADRDHMQLGNEGFELLHVAADAKYTPAQLYLATSEKTGFTKRQRVLQLMHLFKKGLKKGEKKQVVEIAREYVDEGYFLPLLGCMAWAIESGTIDTYLATLEEKFPPLCIYDMDEGITVNTVLKKLSSERWSAQAIRATMNSIKLLREIESSNGTDIEATLKMMSNEVTTIDTLSQEHPELATLCSSCYSLLGCAYGLCRDRENALAAHGKAMLDSGHHETTLLRYIRYVLHPASEVNFADKGCLKLIKERITTLLTSAKNYKPSAYLLYAAFYSHCNDMEEAECFAKKAGEQMKCERNHDERTEEFYRLVMREIYERKRNKQKKWTVNSTREARESLVERVQDGFNVVSRAIASAECEAETNPLQALLYLRQAAYTENMFGIVNLQEKLRTRYTAVIEKIKQAKGRLAADRLSHLERILQELHEKQQQEDAHCTVDPDNNVRVVRLPRNQGL